MWMVAWSECGSTTKHIQNYNFRIFWDYIDHASHYISDALSNIGPSVPYLFLIVRCTCLTGFIWPWPKFSWFCQFTRYSKAMGQLYLMYGIILRRTSQSDRIHMILTSFSLLFDKFYSLSVYWIMIDTTNIFGV